LLAFAAEGGPELTGRQRRPVILKGEPHRGCHDRWRPQRPCPWRMWPSVWC